MPTPAPERLLHMLDNVSGALGLGRGRLDADALISQALRQAGRKDFRDRSFAPALRLLLDCYEHEADLNLFGYHAARWDALRCLSNLLRFEAEEERQPGILREAIERPIFITGLPRSGTSLLHSLLALDPSLRVPRCWQTISPYPGKGADRPPARLTCTVTCSCFSGWHRKWPHSIRSPPMRRRNAPKLPRRSFRACAMK